MSNIFFIIFIVFNNLSVFQIFFKKKGRPPSIGRPSSKSSQHRSVFQFGSFKGKLFYTQSSLIFFNIIYYTL